MHVDSLNNPTLYRTSSRSDFTGKDVRSNFGTRPRTIFLFGGAAAAATPQMLAHNFLYTHGKFRYYFLYARFCLGSNTFIITIACRF